MLFPRKQKQMQKKHQHRVKQELFQVQIMFTERDLAGTYEESGAVYVTLSDDGITGETDGVVIKGQTVTITAEGTYIFPEHCRKDRLWWMQIMRSTDRI